MKDRKNKVVAAIIATIIIVILIIFKQGSVKDDFIEDFMLKDLKGVEQIYVYNDFDGVPAIGTYVYKYELNEIIIDTSIWNSLPFEDNFIESYLDLADVEITNGYYIYNKNDKKEDDLYYFDIAILDSDTNTLYHMRHKSS